MTITSIHSANPALRRVAMVSLHTSPLDQPGTGDAGGMNVYVLELARRLAERQIEVDVFTRATGSALPPLVEVSDGIRVHHVSAGPYEGLTKHELPAQLCVFAREVLRAEARRCLVFCDDLSFEREDADYKALKSVLDGGIEGRPANVLFYATSNRRHLMPRDMIENERATAINPSEATEEKVSLSDRFGLWIGFHTCDQEAYFAMVQGYAEALRLPIGPEALRAEAVEWSVTRGARSGRVAWQCVQDLAGRLGVPA